MGRVRSVLGFGCGLILLVTAFLLCDAAAVEHRSKPQFHHTHPKLFSSLTRNNYVKSSEYYLDQATDFVQDQLEKVFNKKVAKNVILFLGDGMSMPTLAATRMYLGGEEKSLSFEEFPFVGMSKTYCLDYQVPDSACTATSYLSGVKANLGTIGVSGKVKRLECLAANDKRHHTESIAKWAIDAGKSVGLVTTTRVTHASPAGLYAHSAERDWECNADVLNSNCNDTVVDDIAKQLVHSDIGRQLKVIFGGGRGKFYDKTTKNLQGHKGQRTDGRDLIQEWLNYGKTMDHRRTYVWNKRGMASLTADNTDAVLGLFDDSHVKYNYQVDGISDSIPTLSEMTIKAIEILSKNENGFFLFVEGGRIDMAHHDTQAHIALDETAEFAKAIKLAVDELGDEDTLHVVTADHSHTMSYSGYGDRGTNILGVAGRSREDNIPYMKLNYANGNGYHIHRNETSILRLNPAEMKLLQKEFEFPSTMPREAETHGGDDVGVFATGPHAHLFKASFEQYTIPHVIAYASCLGNGMTACT